MLQNISHMSGEGLLCRHLPPYRNSWAKAPALWEVGDGVCAAKTSQSLPAAGFAPQVPAGASAAVPGQPARPPPRSGLMEA